MSLRGIPPSLATALTTLLVGAAQADIPGDAGAPDGAGAQSAPEANTAAPAPRIVPPQVEQEAPVTYPQVALQQGIRDKVEVDLTLDIDPAGNVTRATAVATVKKAFVEAATDAARRLRFTPAQRDGVPVASRIRYRYVFEPPPPPPPDPIAQVKSAEQPSPSAPGPPPPEAPVEVTVHAERRAPMASTYTREEVRRIPGAFGDPFRAIETLPGVTPLASGLPFFYIRGAPPGNVGYFLDGVRVPYLFHVGAGPSVVQPALVRDLELYPAGYPAQFGRFAGGIVSASTTEPRSTLHGEGVLRLFDVGGVVETGFDGGRGTTLAGGRYSYTAALLSLAAPELTLDYRDFQARVSYDVSPDDRVSLFSFGAYDFLEDHGEVQFASEFYRADVRYDHLFDGGEMRVAATFGYDRTHAGLLSPADRRIIADRSVAGRFMVRRAFGKDVALGAGVDVSADVYELQGAHAVDPDLPPVREFERVFPARTDLATGAWLELAWAVTPGFAVLPGVRADLFTSGSRLAAAVDPRLSARLSLTDAVRIIAATGVAHQRPSFVVPLPGVAPVLGSGLQRSVQTGVGVEVDLPAAMSAGGNVFYNAFFDTTDAFGTSGDDLEENLDLRSDGAAFGLELFFRRRLTKRLGGLLSYTLSRSIRRVEGETFFSGFDRTHVVNAALSYDLGRGWRAGARGLYYTGTPVWERERGSARIGTDNVPREPAFFRLDLRLEKRWRLGKTAWISFVAEFFNATLHKETWPGGRVVGPVSIPSLGMEVGF